MGLDPQSILGLSTTELAGVSVDDLVNNKPAIMMVLHYYGQLVDQNNTLRTEVTSLRTYQTGYERARTNAKIGAALLSLSSLGIGFGTNLLTSNTTWAGAATFVPGIAFLIVGLYFSLRSQ